MIAPNPLLLSAALLASLGSAQVYETPGRSKDAYSYTQPEDTVILGQYGHSEPVYPSRKWLMNHTR